MLKLLAVGDVVGEGGMEIIRRRLPALKKELGAQLCIVNGENADPSGTGLHRTVAAELQSYGADIITTGNHALRRALPSFYEENETILCPANFYWAEPAFGQCVYDLGRYRIAVQNLSGVAFMDAAKSPFDLFDSFYKNCGTPFVVVDFHGEATAEKQAFAYYVAERASVVFGTHTHVQTADAMVLPGGCGYITDVGMTGPVYSVIGVKPELAIQKQRLHLPTRFEAAQGPVQLCGALFTLDEASGRCICAEPVKVS